MKQYRGRGGIAHSLKRWMCRSDAAGRAVKRERRRAGGEWLEPRHVLAGAELLVNHPPYLQLGDAPAAGQPGSDFDQISILWQTQTQGPGTDDFRISYRQLGSGLWLDTAPASTIDTQVGARTNYVATVDDIFFDTDYEYRVEHVRNQTVLETFQHTFHTRLNPGNPHAFSFVAFGDAAYDQPPTGLIGVQQRVNQLNPAFALLVGDMAYGDNTDPATAWGSQAAQDLIFDPNVNAPTPTYLATHVAYPAVGNADLATNRGAATRDNFDVPRNGPTDTPQSASYFADRPERDYSFDYGDVHFATFDSGSVFGADAQPDRLADQLNWLVADLQASTARWKVVYTHYPLLASDDGKSASDTYYQQFLAALRTAKVDLLFVGDSHTYQRSYPLTGSSAGKATFVTDVDNNYDKGAGLVQVVIGTGGRGVNPANFGGDAYLARGMSASTNPAAELGVAKIDVVGNQLTISYIAADDGGVLDTFTIKDQAPLTVSARTLPAGETVWAAADGPRHVTSKITVPAGATLRIEPGAQVTFAASGEIDVSGRLLAEGSPYRHISFSAPAGSTTQWNGLKFLNTMEDNRLTYLDMSDGMARSNGILIQKSKLTVDHTYFRSMNGNILQLQEVALSVSNSLFPSVNKGEPIESTMGMADFGYIVIESSVFGQSLGGNDTIDIQGGRRVGRMLQVLNNVFFGGPDEALDLDIDAHIEGNLFMNNRSALAPPRADGITSSISTGTYVNVPGVGTLPTILTVTRNVFYNVDHVMGIKDRTFVHFHQNTVVNATLGGLQFYDPSRKTVPGQGALVEGSLFVNTPNPLAHINEGPSGAVVTQLAMNNSMVDATLPAALRQQLLALGHDNLAANPLLVDAAQDFHLSPGSPAIGAGTAGLDMGAYVANPTPDVVRVLARGTQWSPDIINQLIAMGYTAAGYPLDPHRGGTVPWDGVDEISIQFSEGVVVDRNSLSLRSTDGTPYPVASFSFDTVSFTGKWKLATPIAGSQIQLELNEQVADYAGGRLRPVGESYALAFGVGVAACDVNRDGQCDAADIDALAAALGTNQLAYDLDGSGSVDELDRDRLVRDYFHTWYGDANLDLQFSTEDLVSVFQLGKYEDDVPDNAGWSDGDWNGDGEFDSDDIVLAFQDGGYESGPRPAVASIAADRADAVDAILAIGTNSTRRLAYIA